MSNIINNNSSVHHAPLLANIEAKKNPSNITSSVDVQQQIQKQVNDKSQEWQNKVTHQDEFSPTAKGLQAAASVENSQSLYSYSQTMSMELTTREGDVVKLDFRQLYAQYQESKHERLQEQVPQGVRMFDSKQAMEATAFEERFAFSVEGHLNEDELQAILNVFEKVDDLARSFFGGNIEEAFQKAVSMDIDMEQLQSFNLDLQRTEIQATSYQQVAAYQGVEQQSLKGDVAAAAKDADNEGKVSDLPPYLQKMQDVIASLDEQFEMARQTFEELMSGVLFQQHPETPQSSWFDRLQNFHNQLSEAANLNKTTLAPSGLEVTPLQVADESLSPPDSSTKPS